MNEKLMVKIAVGITLCFMVLLGLMVASDFEEKEKQKLIQAIFIHPDGSYTTFEDLELFDEEEEIASTGVQSRA